MKIDQFNANIKALRSKYFRNSARQTVEGADETPASIVVTQPMLTTVLTDLQNQADTLSED